jgi:hypothetical protein
MVFNFGPKYKGFKKCRQEKISLIISSNFRLAKGQKTQYGTRISRGISRYLQSFYSNPDDVNLKTKEKVYKYNMSQFGV